MRFCLSREAKTARLPTKCEGNVSVSFRNYWSWAKKSIDIGSEKQSADEFILHQPTSPKKKTTTSSVATAPLPLPTYFKQAGAKKKTSCLVFTRLNPPFNKLVFTSILMPSAYATSLAVAATRKMATRATANALTTTINNDNSSKTNKVVVQKGPTSVATSLAVAATRKMATRATANALTMAINNDNSSKTKFSKLITNF